MGIQVPGMEKSMSELMDPDFNKKLEKYNEEREMESRRKPPPAKGEAPADED